MNSTTQRFSSLDAFRGFDILLMIFVNLITGMDGVPLFLRHASAEMDMITLKDIVFPGFLFIVGVAIPIALGKRLERGDSQLAIIKHVIYRSLVLLFIGAVMANRDYLSATATGMSMELWYVLFYIAVILLWASYPKPQTAKRRLLYLTLRGAAVVVIAILLFLFRGQAADGQIIWLRHYWWGILGIIGWTYLAGSLSFLLTKGNRTALLGIIGLMIALYFNYRYGALPLLKPLSHLVNWGGVLGSRAAIVVAGVFVGTLFAPRTGVAETPRRITIMILFGVGLLAAGFLLRPVHGFSKVYGTASYALATAGISCLAFTLFYWLLDVLDFKHFASFLRPVGTNALLAYIISEGIMYFCKVISVPLSFNIWQLLWPFWQPGGMAGMLNGIFVTALVMLLASAFSRMKIVVKL